ncbi:alpha-hydroxy-acid oxidizing protein [Stackebrandtia soli]|uniref:alpha-hydroxy-acid oxidizing protein n=1 Tax=Stackebrandtia soli TaxID=1892856 RepID=UPI0039E909AE
MKSERRDGLGRQAQSRIFRDGTYGRRPLVPVDPDLLERKAKRAMSRRAYAYVAGSAGMERTADANRRAFGDYRIVPRVLRDVEDRDLSVELFGRRLDSPLLFSPVGVLELAHRDADLAVADAARELGMPMVISTQASTTLEDCASRLDGSPAWFQLYWSNNDDLVTSLVQRAETSGCDAIVITLDTHMIGWRPRDLDLGSLPFARGEGLAQYTSDPVFTRLVEERAARGDDAPKRRPTLAAIRSLLSMSRKHPGGFWNNLRSPLPRAAVETFLEVFSRSSLTWDELSFVRERTKLPIILKGIMDTEDAHRAVDCGVDGIQVSNHGGRQIDGSFAAIDALPEVAAAVDGRVPIIFDSGVRTGSDVFTALALGAKAVAIGRPYVYGMAVAGAEGATEAMRNILAELDLTMGLAGCATLADITSRSIRRC